MISQSTDHELRMKH